MAEFNRHSRRTQVGAHLAGIGASIAVVTLSYFAFYADRVTDPTQTDQLSFNVIAASDGLQLWRVGATKALSPNADVRLIYATDQVCGIGDWNDLSRVEVRPVVHLANGSFLRPGRIRLSANETTLSRLCDKGGPERYAFWSTDSKDLKVDLERLGQVPAYYAAGH